MNSSAHKRPITDRTGIDLEVTPWWRFGISDGGPHMMVGVMCSVTGADSGVSGVCGSGGGSAAWARRYGEVASAGLVYQPPPMRVPATSTA